MKIDKRPPRIVLWKQSDQTHIPTVAEAIVAIFAAPDLSLKRKRNLVAALRLLARSYGTTPELVRLDPAELSRRFLTKTAAQLGIDPVSMPTYHSSVRAVLRRFGLIERPRRTGHRLSQLWADIIAAVPDKFSSIRLQDFAAWCDAQGIAPADVMDATLIAYYEHLSGQRLVRNVSARVNRVASAWNNARREVPNWPMTVLKAPNLSNCISDPLRAYPQVLQDEVDAWIATHTASARTSFYTKGGHATLWRPATIDTRLANLRLILKALVATGTPIDSITSLAVVVTPEAVHRAIDWHWVRAGNSVCAHTASIAITLAVLAKHVGLKGKVLEEVQAITKAAKPPKRTRMTDKNERRLAQMDDPVNFAVTLHLSAQLMIKARAAHASGDHLGAAWTASIAVVVEILLRCPLRIETLHKLRLDVELVSLDSRHGHFTHLDVPRYRVKNGEPIRCKLSQSTAALIKEFLRDFRPALPGAAGPYLFAGRKGPDHCRRKSSISNAVADTFAKEIGLEFNIHLFRGLACKLVLDDKPEAIHDLRLILGHRTLNTALEQYTSVAPQKAAERLDRLVTGLQRQTAKTARAAFTRGKPKKPKAPIKDAK